MPSPSRSTAIERLGSFTLANFGQTGQITGRTLAGSTLATTWSYLPNSGDRRLAGISNTGLSTGQYTNLTLASMPENLISGVTESSDTGTVYPPTGTQTATYNNLNQLTNLSGQAYTYDTDGNLTSDGMRDYAWDAENRLVEITYPGHSGEQTSFAYDGLGRRTSITSIAGATTSYLWCGSRLCQARNASGATTKEYYAEGEYAPGSPAQPSYYGVDQLGTVRRAFQSTTSAPAYVYDPYGQPLQTTAPVTDFNYAGMLTNADSSLDLTQYRIYNPTIGRWLSRDPLGEATDPAANLYAYVEGNSISLIDWLGLCGLTPNQIANIIFNETQSLSGPNIDQAYDNITDVILNDKPNLPQMAPDTANVPPSEQQLYNQILSDVQNTINQYNNGVDPTNGATNFNFRSNNYTGPFYGLPLQTQVGPLNNSYPTSTLPATNIYANTYGTGKK